MLITCISTKHDAFEVLRLDMYVTKLLTNLSIMPVPKTTANSGICLQRVSLFTETCFVFFFILRKNNFEVLTRLYFWNYTCRVLELCLIWVIYILEQCMYYQWKELEKMIPTIANSQTQLNQGLTKCQTGGL